MHVVERGRARAPRKHRIWIYFTRGDHVLNMYSGRNTHGSTALLSPAVVNTLSSSPASHWHPGRRAHLLGTQLLPKYSRCRLAQRSAECSKTGIPPGRRRENVIYSVETKRKLRRRRISRARKNKCLRQKNKDIELFTIFFRIKFKSNKF